MKHFANSIVCQIARMQLMLAFTTFAAVYAYQVAVTIRPTLSKCKSASFCTDAASLAHGVMRLVARSSFVLVVVTKSAVGACKVARACWTTRAKPELLPKLTASALMTGDILCITARFELEEIIFADAIDCLSECCSCAGRIRKRFANSIVCQIARMQLMLPSTTSAAVHTR